MTIDYQVFAADAEPYAHVTVGKPSILIRVGLEDDEDPETTAQRIVALLAEDRSSERGATLGGSIEPTGYWVLDDLGPIPGGVNVVTLADPPRPGLRGPDGGCWTSWIQLPELDGLREQLAAGARALRDADRLPPPPGEPDWTPGGQAVSS